MMKNYDKFCRKPASLELGLSFDELETLVGYLGQLLDEPVTLDEADRQVIESILKKADQHLILDECLFCCERCGKIVKEGEYNNEDGHILHKKGCLEYEEDGDTN